MDKVGNSQQPLRLPGTPVAGPVADEDDGDASPYHQAPCSLIGKPARQAMISAATVARSLGLPVTLGPPGTPVTPVVAATSVYSSSPPVYTASASLPGLFVYGPVTEDD